MPEREELLERAAELGIEIENIEEVENDRLEIEIQAMEDAAAVVEAPAEIVVEVEGVRGTFHLQNDVVPVSFLLTSASLSAERVGENQKMKQHRQHMQKLLQYSTPVREIIDVSELNFEELMQRDLDDYRISQDIITYLTGDPPDGVPRNEINADTLNSPRFFPPILAVIVPFHQTEKNIEEKYADHSTVDVGNGKATLENLGPGIDIIHQNSSPSSRLRLDGQKAKLVIVDGQHRAMAVLAAYRTAHSQWGNANIIGQTTNHLEAMYSRNSVEIETLKNLDLPVCLIYFPTIHGDEPPTTIIEAVRKLFLDVNKNAKQPSEIRRVLMDDYSLTSMCLRHLLNSTSERTEGFQLHHVDTDSDCKWEDYKAARKLCSVNVRILYELIHRIFNETADVVGKMDFSDAGSRNLSRLRGALRMRKMLGIDKISKTKLNTDYGFVMEEIVDDKFPKTLGGHIKDKFNEGWGDTIIKVYSDFEPWNKRNLAANHIREKIEGIDVHDDILGYVKMALKEGQGGRDSIQKLADRERRIRERSGAEQKEPLEKAWERIGEYEDTLFPKLRAKAYCGIDFADEIDDDKITKVNRIYSKYRTMAFQLGTIEAFMYLMDCYPNDTVSKLKTRSKVWILFLNKAYEDDQVRYISMDESEEHSFFGLLKDGLRGDSMGLVSFSGFKGFMMELLHLKMKDDDGVVTLTGNKKITQSEITKIEAYITSARHKLFYELYKKKRADLARIEQVNDDTLSDEDALSIVAVSARKKVEDRWKAVYKASFGINKGEWSSFVKWTKIPE